MKYTLEQLQSMSDLDLNIAVTKSQGFVVDGWYENTSVVIAVDENGNNGFQSDYCNKPSDMCELIISEGISLIYQIDNNYWCASTMNTPFVHDKNPLRAAAIVYVLVRQVQGI